MERLRQIKANEDALRQADAADKALEKAHQAAIAVQNQHLGAVAGCRDEMDRFSKILQESTSAAGQTKSVATQFISDHTHSVVKNVERDLLRVEAQVHTAYCSHCVVVYHCTMSFGN
jgi:hypothetical protein